MQGTQFVHVPIDLAKGDPHTLRAYLILVDLAMTERGKELFLPPRDVRAKLYGVRVSRVVALESTLSDLGLLSVQNCGGKGYKNPRRRIVVKYQITQAFAQEAHDVDRPVQFSESLTLLKLSCRNQDVQRRSLKDFTDQQLYVLSGGASEADIRQAIIEVENFKPSDRRPLFNIGKAFARRFENGKLKSDRPGALSEAVAQPKQTRDVDPVTASFRDQAAAQDADIHPDVDHRPADVDRIMTRVAQGAAVEVDTLPKCFRLSPSNALRGAFVLHPDLTMTIRDGYTVGALAPGFWKVVKKIPQEKGRSK